MTLKHHYNGFPEEEKPVLLFEDEGDLLSDKELISSEKYESCRAQCFLKAQISFVSNLNWSAYLQY